MSEEIIGRINGIQRDDSKIFNVVFTNNRVIGELVGGSGVAMFAFGAVGAAVAESRLKKKAHNMDESKTPDEILAGHKKNFEVNNFDIEQIEVNKTLLGGQIYLKCTNPPSNYKSALLFSFNKKRIDEVEVAVKKAFPNKSVVKK